MNFPPIFTACMASEAVTDLLGLQPLRVFPHGEAPENVARPYVTWQIVSGNPENYLADRPDVDGWRLQVDIWGDTVASVQQVASAMADAIEGQSYITSWRGTSKDPSTGRRRLSFDADWHTYRSPRSS